jgi:hypothetical protein
MIGLSLEVIDNSVTTLFPTALNGTLYSYGGSYVAESSLDNGKGYWLRFNEVGASTIQGLELGSINLALAEGWNMISGPTWASIITDPDSIVVSNTLFGYNGAYFNASELEPGGGYWIRTSAAGTVTVESEWGGGRIASSNHLSEASSLTFTDASGYSSNLYYGVSVPEEARLSYSLPPVPPAGGFDVRFAGDMLYTEETGEILVQSGSYPVIISYDTGNELWILDETNSDAVHELKGSGSIKVTSPVDGYTLTRGTYVPNEFSLKQNYPNPFNPVTTIAYDIADEVNVRISVYNMLGQLVGELVNDVQPSGRYHIQWNGLDISGVPVSSGVYIYRIEAGTYTDMKKMLLVK